MEYRIIIHFSSSCWCKSVCLTLFNVWPGQYTDKKENKIFFINKEIHKGSVAKSYMTYDLLFDGSIFAFSSYIRKPFLIYDFATDPIWISLCDENYVSFFISVAYFMRSMWKVRGGSKEENKTVRRQTLRQTDRQTDRQADAQTNRQTDTGTDRLAKKVVYLPAHVE